MNEIPLYSRCPSTCQYPPWYVDYVWKKVQRESDFWALKLQTMLSHKWPNLSARVDVTLDHCLPFARENGCFPLASSSHTLQC